MRLWKLKLSLLMRGRREERIKGTKRGEEREEEVMVAEKWRLKGKEVRMEDRGSCDESSGIGA